MPTPAYPVPSQLTNTLEGPDSISRILAAIRTHLGMDVAFISQFADGRRFFRHIESGACAAPMSAGDSNPLEDSYCQRVVDGRLPELIQDASLIPEALKLPVTRALPVGAHMSVPIRFRDGTLYGTFCCFSFKPELSMNKRDLNTMRAFADLAAHQIEQEQEADRRHREKHGRIADVLLHDQFTMVFQPIFDINDEVIGLEALSRFSAEPQRTPDIWFTEAAQAGLGVELELAALRKALAALRWLPSRLYVSANLSPETIVSSELVKALEDYPQGRIVLEVTEHAAVADYVSLHRALTPLRSKGVRLAIDDAGAGFASLRHVLALNPDIIKLDVSLIRNIDADKAKRAMASALTAFAAETDCLVVAEGVETVAELKCLRDIGVDAVQGYILARPMRPGDLRAFLNPNLESVPRGPEKGRAWRQFGGPPLEE